MDRLWRTRQLLELIGEARSAARAHAACGDARDPDAIMNDLLARTVFPDLSAAISQMRAIGRAARGAHELQQALISQGRPVLAISKEPPQHPAQPLCGDDYDPA